MPHGTCWLLHTSLTLHSSSSHCLRSQKGHLCASPLILRGLTFLVFLCIKPQYFLHKLPGPVDAVLSSKSPKPFLGSGPVSHHLSIAAQVFFTRDSFCCLCEAFCLTSPWHHLHSGFLAPQSLAFAADFLFSSSLSNCVWTRFLTYLFQCSSTSTIPAAVSDAPAGPHSKELLFPFLSSGAMTRWFFVLSWRL